MLINQLLFLPFITAIMRLAITILAATPCSAFLSSSARVLVCRCRPPVCAALGHDELRAGEDPWAIVGVPRHASDDEIRRAFRQRARNLHPDMGGDARSFRRLVRAHDILTKANRRAWDQQAAARQQRWDRRPGSASGPDSRRERHEWYSALSSVAYLYIAWASLLWIASHS